MVAARAIRPCSQAPACAAGACARPRALLPRRLRARIGFDPRRSPAWPSCSACPSGQGGDPRNTEAPEGRRRGRTGAFNTGGSSGEPHHLHRRPACEPMTSPPSGARRAGGDVDIGDPGDSCGARRSSRRAGTGAIPAGSAVPYRAAARLRDVRHEAGRLRRPHPARAAEDALRLPSALSHIGLHAEGAGFAWTTSASRWRSTSGAPLRPPAQAIRRVFNCPVANGYGSRDAGFIAHQCPRKAACTSLPGTSLSDRRWRGRGAAARRRADRRRPSRHRRLSPSSAIAPGDVAVMDARPAPAGAACRC